MNRSMAKQSMNKSMASLNTSKYQGRSGYGGGTGGGGKDERKAEQRVSDLIEIFKRATNLRDELMKFDRQLADSVKPLTDLSDKNIYYNVIDKYAQGQDKKGDADEL